MNKARVLSDEFQAAEIKLEELYKKSGVTYKTFDTYESTDETTGEEIGSKHRSKGLFSFRS